MIQHRFTPHPLILGGHAQTIGGTYLWSAPPYKAVTHIVELQDGDKIVLHDDCPKNWTGLGKVAVLVHGLAGCHGSGYMRRIAHKLTAAGHRCFRMDQRGCGAGVDLAAGSTNGARIGDVAAALSYVRTTCPQSEITAVGFSLGGAMTLRLAGEMRDAFPADRLMAIAPPIDFWKCSDSMERGLNRGYSRYFAKLLVRRVNDNSALRQQLRADVLKSPPKTLAEFDHRVTAPLGGFSSVDEYYAAASPVKVLSSVRAPTLILSAADDPIVVSADIETAKASASVFTHITRHGGHLGFLSGRRSPGDPDWHWMDWRVVDFVAGDH
ncbi:MAG: alpha/beta fold hydrolase [Planctomycetales bacterium]|nr:alpha/beta fold hydrolase [Planctomycetales bacterium]